MDEAGARALLERMSVVEAPPSRVDIAMARRRGGKRLRRRRWARAVAPVLAAAAVAAVVLGTGALPLVGGQGSTGPERPGQVRPPHRFNPLAPYAAFGWLPRGVPRAAAGVISLPSQLLLITGSVRTGDFSLRVWAPGTCNVNAAQVTGGLGAQRGYPYLDCSQHGFADFADYVVRRAPAVTGRPAFWLIDDTLAWEYAPHAWATLSAYLGQGLSHARTMVKIAAHVRFAAARVPSLRFPFQLTGLPASWHAVSAVWRPTSRGLAGGALAVGPASASPGMGVISQIGVAPAGHATCGAPPGSARVTLRGVRAFLTLRGPHNGTPASQELCVPHADGLSVSFTLYRPPGSPAFPLGGATGIFLHHLRLLGPNPANWTTRPLG